MNPKFKSVSLKFDTYDKVGSLSKTITPGINLSFANTIDYAVEKLIGDRVDSTNGKNNGIANGYNQKEISK
jgi:hypothetical protein|tara:strand:+ start:362 stop:574 length:213 start_codon:yes stop_codon:yes gene_type:complete